MNKARSCANRWIPAKRLYTLREAATYLGRTEYSVRERIWGRDLPVVRKGPNGKMWLDLYDLDSFIETHKHFE